MDNVQIQLSSSFSDAAAKLQKPIRSKVTSTMDEFYKNPQSKGLHLEKLSGPSLWSARVDDNYRIIFAQPEGTNLILLLYVDSHEKAYRWAETHHAEINPLLGSLEVVKTAMPKITKDPHTKTLCSRLSALWDKHLLKMGVPEEYWPQLRTKVFNKTQLIPYKALIPEAAYHAMEYILEGQSVEDAMMIFEAESAEVVPEGITEKDTIESVITFVPEKDTDKSILFRFSQKFGLTDTDDLSGIPYYIKVDDLHKMVSNTATVEGMKKSKDDANIYANLPGKIKLTLFKEEQELGSQEFYAAQFGKTLPLDNELFGKKLLTSLVYNPTTGNIDTIKTEMLKKQ